MWRNGYYKHHKVILLCAPPLCINRKGSYFLCSLLISSHSNRSVDCLATTNHCLVPANDSLTPANHSLVPANNKVLKQNDVKIQTDRLIDRRYAPV